MPIVTRLREKPSQILLIYTMLAFCLQILIVLTNWELHTPFITHTHTHTHTHIYIYIYMYELCWLKRIETLQVDGDGVKGRPRKRWREALKEDMRKKGLCREDAWDRSRWRRMLWEGHR